MDTFVENAGAVASVIGAIASWIAFFVSRHSNKLQTSALLVTIEDQIRDAEKDATDAAAALGQPCASENERTLRQRNYEAKKEAYLNRLERLAFETLAGRLDNKEMKRQYRNLIRETIRQYRDHYGAGTDFSSTIKLHEKWDGE